MPPTPDPADSWPGAGAPGDAHARLARSAEGATLGLPRIEAEQYVAVRAERVEPFYLLLYAEGEEKDALALHQALDSELRSRDCPWPVRDWHRPDAGDPKAATRSAWLQDARFVLVLASPALIADFKGGGLVADTERPLFILALRAVDEDQCRGTPLVGLPVFSAEGADPWTARRGPGRDQWVRDAAVWLLAAIRRPERAPDPFVRLRRPDWDRFGDLPDSHYVHQHTEVPGAHAGRVAIELLRDWLADPQASVLCAVFGELGMGKTTLCQRLTRELLKGRDAGEPLPLPVYLDLRAVNTMDWDWSRGAPPLPAMLEHIVASAYDLGVDEPRPSAADIARLAQQGGGLILCDGLDEVMNRLTPEQCRLFIERLWSILPPKLWKPPPGLTPEQARTWHRPPEVGRLLMTCRSHFFQTLQDQVNALIGQQRAPIARADYLWATLLPFDSRQVETYFRQVFAADPAQAERVIAMLDEVHDLKELGSRPYNLRLIQGQVDELETIQREGRRVSIADLYEVLVGQWMLRDDPKHRLNRDHKLLLMERLALRLWAGGEADLGYQVLNDWLVAQIRTEPGWRQVEYQSYLARDGGVEVLKEDLRNATFLVREGEGRFRFAHTSIQEFFLARALHRALVEDRLDDWAVAVPSAETLEFLGGLIAMRETAACLDALGRIRAGYRARVSELALAYAMSAYAKDMPGADFAGFQLPGVELRFQRWEGREDRLMDWRGSDFSGARLDGGRFIDCDFSGSRFDGADLVRTLFDRCRLDRVTAHASDLKGATFHDCSVVGIDLTDVRLQHTQWLGSQPVGLRGSPPALFSQCSLPFAVGAMPGTVAGQSNVIRCAIAAADGTWLASAGDDSMVLVWDVGSGRELHRLQGHKGVVQALVAPPKGGWLVSAGADGCVLLWDLASGRELYRMKGHEAGITALAVAKDGTWLASADDAGHIRIWDPANGRQLHHLEAHEVKVAVLTVAPDGGWLASGDESGLVVLWDPASGRELHRLKGHDEAVFLLVASDAGWLASGGADASVVLWDPDTGRELRQLEYGEGGVLGLAAAPNGSWLAAGGIDGPVIIWDTASGCVLHCLWDHSAWVESIAIASNGAWLATTGEDGWIRLWDPLSGRELHQLTGGGSWLLAFSAVPTGDWLAFGGGNGRILLFDPAADREVYRLEGSRVGVRALTTVPGGKGLASAGDDGQVRIWDPVSGRILYTLKGHSGWVSALVPAPDGSWLASAGFDGRTVLWDPSSGSEIFQLEDQRGWVHALAVAPDGSALASLSTDCHIIERCPANGWKSRRLNGQWRSVSVLLLAPNGRWLARGSTNGTVRILRTGTGRKPQDFQGHRGAVRSLLSPPHGAWLASAGDDGQIVLWDPKIARVLRRINGHRGAVRALAAPPDGAWLASGGDDGSVVIWDPSTGLDLHRLDVYGGGIRALTVAPDGSWLASAGDDGKVRIWSVPPDGTPPLCAAAIEHLPESNWVTWHDPDGPNRRWVHWSRDAWRWLGWHAPLPDGKHWMYHPMDAFRAADADERGN